MLLLSQSSDRSFGRVVSIPPALSQYVPVSLIECLERDEVRRSRWKISSRLAENEFFSSVAGVRAIDDSRTLQY